MEPKQPIKDDGRTIANMNVPGMPWYVGTEGAKVKSSPGQGERENSFHKEPICLTKGEKKAIFKGVMGAILPIVMLFAIGYLGIFLFMDFVWLR